MKSNTKQIAKERIRILFHQADRINKEKPELARRYIETARKIAMAARLRFPKEYKRQSCKKCNSLLIPGDTLRVRIRQRREPHIVNTCIICDYKTRIPINKEGNKC